MTGTDYTPDNGKEKVTEVSRRRFLTFLFAAASAISVPGFFAPVIRYAYPVLQKGAAERKKVGSTAELTPGGDGIKFDYDDVPGEVIQLKDGSYVAYSLVCTHLGCIVKWEVNNQVFHCPCHGGKFDTAGAVIAGPPPSPLKKFKIAVAGNEIFVEGME